MVIRWAPAWVWVLFFTFIALAVWRQCNPPNACQCAAMGHAR